MTSGIYKITNKHTGKSYIGASYKIERRLNEHKRKESRIGKIMAEEGMENFSFEIIHECPIEELEENEIKYIQKYNSYENGYNETPGGESHFNQTGYYRVFKSKSKQVYQGFIWGYNYPISPGKFKQISNIDLNILKKEVISQGLPWKVLNEEKAKQSIEENKNNEYLHEKRKNKTGFYRVSKNKDSKMLQGHIWRYQYYDEFGLKQVISNVDFYKLEDLVKAEGLPWIIIDAEKADITLKDVEENSIFKGPNPNFTGYYRVYKSMNDEVRQGFMYKYDFRNNDGDRIIIQNVDLNKLKNIIISKGYTWKVVNPELAKLTDEENKSFEKYHKPYSSTGFYRVSKENTNRGKGYRWSYQYREDNRNRKVSSVDLLKLEDKVKSKGLPWFVTDDELANATLKKEYGNTLL